MCQSTQRLQEIQAPPPRRPYLTFLGLFFVIDSTINFDVGNHKVKRAVIVILEPQQMPLLEQDCLLFIVQIEVGGNKARHNLLIRYFITTLGGHQLIVTVLNGREGDGLRRGRRGGQKGHVPAGICVGVIGSKLDNLELVSVANAEVVSHIAADFGLIGGHLLGLDGGVRGTATAADHSNNLTGLDLELLGLLGGDVYGAVGLGADRSLLCKSTKNRGKCKDNVVSEEICMADRRV